MSPAPLPLFLKTESYYLGQVRVELGTLLPLTPECWIMGMHHHAQFALLHAKLGCYIEP